MEEDDDDADDDGDDDDDGEEEEEEEDDDDGDDLDRSLAEPTARRDRQRRRPSLTGRLPRTARSRR